MLLNTTLSEPVESEYHWHHSKYFWASGPCKEALPLDSMTQLQLFSEWMAQLDPPVLMQRCGGGCVCLFTMRLWTCAKQLIKWPGGCALVISPLTACCLTALDKCPGIRPIEVEETLRHLICKRACVHMWGYFEGGGECTAVCGVISSMWDRDIWEPLWRCKHWSDTYGRCFQFIEQGSGLEKHIHPLPVLVPVLINTYHTRSRLSLMASASSHKKAPHKATRMPLQCTPLPHCPWSGGCRVTWPRYAMPIMRWLVEEPLTWGNGGKGCKHMHCLFALILQRLDLFSYLPAIPRNTN